MNQEQEMSPTLEQYESDSDCYTEIDSDEVESDCGDVYRCIIESHTIFSNNGVISQECQEMANQTEKNDPLIDLMFFQGVGKLIFSLSTSFSD